MTWRGPPTRMAGTCEPCRALREDTYGTCTIASSQPAANTCEHSGTKHTVCHAHVRADQKMSHFVTILFRNVRTQLLGLYDKFGSKVVRSTPAFLVGGKLVGALSQEDKGLLGSSRGISSSTAGGGGGGEGVGKGATGRTTSGFQQVVRLDANGDLDLRAVIRELGKASTEAAAGGGTASLGDDEAMGLLLSHPAVETVLDRWGFAFSFWTLGEVQDLLTEHRCVCRTPKLGYVLYMLHVR